MPNKPSPAGPYFLVYQVAITTADGDLVSIQAEGRGPRMHSLEDAVERGVAFAEMASQDLRALFPEATVDRVDISDGTVVRRTLPSARQRGGMN